MFSEIKKTIKQTAIYSLGNISTKLVGFILLPLYTDYLLPEEYGILAILQAILQILIGIFGFNLPTAMMRWYASENDIKKRNSIIFNTFFSTTIIAIILGFILIPFSENFSQQIFSTKQFSNYFMFLLLAASAGIVSNVPLNVIRLKELPTFYVILSTLKFIVIVLLNIYFVAYAKLGVEGIMISELIGSLLVILLSLPVIIKNSNFILNFKILKEMFLYGFPLVFSTTFSFLLTLGDRFIIEYFHGSASVGIYSLGHKVASVMNMLILQSFQLGFLPLAYKKFGTPNDKRYFSKVLTYYATILAFAALGISMFGKEIIETFAQNKEYWLSSTVIPIIAFAFVIKGIQYNFSLSFHYAKKTVHVTAIVVFTAFINVLLNFILIPSFGFIGAAYSLLLSTILMMILSYYFGQKIYKIPFELVKISKIVAIALLLYFVSLFVSNYGQFLNILIQFLLIILFPILLFKISIFEEIEILSLKRGVKDFITLISGKR
ncbi:MAG: oligosaccharide flippase family protein [Melioribacteraceae bacterium]|nr:oligosaccharide flippase family protein [Melioribacteraceae bacterium]